MPTTPDLPPESPAAPALPDASRDAQGCLLLPGCFGKILLVLFALSILAWATGWAGNPQKGFGVSDPATFCLVVLSALVFEALARRLQKPWVFWAASACLGGWVVNLGFWMEFETGEPPEIRRGSWLMAALPAAVLLRFVLSRENRAYYTKRHHDL